jgi:PAS domain-containing protein
MNALLNGNPVPVPDDQSFFDLLAGSYARLLNRPLGAGSASWLYHQAPFVVLAHNTDPDPRFIYANKAAQACFGYSWDEFVALPSRLSAEEMLREERQAVLETVARNGFIADYGGVRIAKSGRRFRISGTVIWQLIDDTGAIHGQAATFSQWSDVEL